MELVCDTIIIGAGPAAAAAAVYAGRKRMQTLLLAENFESQSFVSDSIENWIGSVKISGYDLAKMLENHVRAQPGVKVLTGKKVSVVRRLDDSVFEVCTEDSCSYRAKTVIIASGGRRRRLGIPGEEKFEGRGVAFCSTCDAPVFHGRTVAVVGGGNAGMEAVIDLLPYANHVYLLTDEKDLRGDQATREDILKNSKVTVIYQASPKEIFGDKEVEGMKYVDLEYGEVQEIRIEGVFVEAGSVANSELVEGIVKTNDRGEIIIDHRTGETSEKGVFAAGDVTNAKFKQNNIAAGDGIKAALSAYDFLLGSKWQKS